MRQFSEEDVLGDREIRSEGEFLVDDGDAVSARRARAAKIDALAVDANLAELGTISPPSTRMSVDLPAPFSPISA